MEELRPAALPPRTPDTHKGSYGTVLVVAGSRRYPGAAALAALGAGRAGAGLVRAALPEGTAACVLPVVPFAICVECPAGPDGAFAAAATDLLLAEAASCQAVVLGPGLGGGDETAFLVHELVGRVRAPLVVDADALNHLARPAGTNLLAARRAPTVLTPHPGEFARLAGGEVPHGTARAERAARWAAETGTIVVLKGHRTVVSDGRRLYVEEAGNPGMATGGMGDVLAGVLASLLAQLPDPAAAAALGVHLHARAGDLAAHELGEESVLPTDVADRLGRALRQLRGHG